MITVLDLGPNVIAYRAEGRLERSDIDRVFEEVDQKLAGGRKVRVYSEVHTFSGISLDGLWQDIRQSIERWKSISSIEKAALVTDVGWLRKAAIWEDRVFFGIEIRTFSLAERVDAEAWVRA